MSHSRRSFLKEMGTGLGAVAFAGSACEAEPEPTAVQVATVVPEQIKAFCIDFNWLVEGQQDWPNRFAKPGHWADASPQEHVVWYEALGANVIQTFAVSCNGYAWYKNGLVPAQPGLKHDFLTDVVRLGHQKGMLVMGYFCAGANSKWGFDQTDLSYGTPSTLHIPFTDQYLDYLAASIEDAVNKSGMDGFMIDWVWNPSDKLREGGWIEAEQKLYEQLMGQPFPASGQPSTEDLLAYERKSIERCWTRIRDAAKGAKSDCIVWLSCNKLDAPTVAGSRMLAEVDWVMNEAPDRALLEAGGEMKGQDSRLLQCLVGWTEHNAKTFLSDPANHGLDLYGFAMPRDTSLPLPIEEYLGNPIDAFAGEDRLAANDRNIAALARFYNGLALDAIAPREG